MDWFGVIKLTGPDRATWLQGMVTNDVVKLAAGYGCYAAHLTPQGKIVAQMHVLVDEDALWLVLERAAIPKLVAEFNKLLIMEDVQIADLSQQYSILGVPGPRAQAAIEAWMNQPLTISGQQYVHQNFNECRIVVSDLGYEVWVPRPQARSILHFLGQHGATAIDHGTWDVLRTEAGIPVYGVDIDETTTMPEIGSRGISYDKGCYIGQEVVAKVKYLGHVNRQFAGLTLSGANLPDVKTPIRKDGRDAGYITTVLFSPGLQQPIALGFVSRAAYAPGNEVEVGGSTATIVDLPFRKQT
jgi:folate-binding protein YgfZ